MDIRPTDCPSDNSYGSKVQDLGRIDEPLLICGGAYSNLEALTALFDAARKLAIPAKRIIHTGDIVAYCADPAPTAELLRKSGVHAIQGNVEESLSASLPDCGCGFDDGSTCDRLSAEWFAYSDARIDDGLRQWMGQLPQQLTFEMSGRRARVVHGAVDQINRFIFAPQPESDFEAEFNSAKADMIIAGHSGIPFTRHIGARVWHNSGSLGLPANDGTPRVWFSVLTPQGSALRIEFHALDYDHETARAKMIRANVCREYAQALSTGVWPSLDILPEAAKKQTGTPLELGEPYIWESREAAVN